MTQWKLIVEQTGEDVVIGGNYPDFRNEICMVIGGTPPRSLNSSGRVEILGGFEYYPTVFGMKWVAAQL